MKERKFPSVYPTASFGGLLFVLAAMWYAASSQNSAAVYLLLFTLTAVFLVSIPQTLINLAVVTIKLESAKPAFAGQEISLAIEIMNRSRATRHGITVARSGASRELECVDRIAAGKSARVTLRFPARQRGEHKIGALCLTSVYPLGFVRVSKKFATSQSYVVYPKPAGDLHLPLSRGSLPQCRSQADIGEGDDFAGLRSYVPGEPQRHIDWKAVARGQPLMTKQFTAEAQGVVYLDFSAVRFTDVEARLSQLALWIIEAERARRPYGLHLPGIEIPPAVGESHFHQCLRALGRFQAGDTALSQKSAGVGPARPVASFRESVERADPTIARYGE